MKKFLILLSVLIMSGTVAIWVYGGFHLGWTQNQIPVEMVDDVTGIEFREYQDGFRAGLDFLIGGAFLSTLLILFSLFFRCKGNKGCASTSNT